MLRYRNAAYILLCAFFLFYACKSYAEDKEEITTDEIVVTDKKETKQYGTEITRDEIDRTNAKSLWDVIRYTPGVTLTDGGTRGDASFSIRGFSSTTIPVIVDGISITNPFNGWGDSSGILTDDLESVVIQKGFSSMLNGANGMGGAVILTTAKPEKLFEGKFKTTLELDSRFNTSAITPSFSLGSKSSKFYIKTSLQYKDMDHFRLSDKYEPVEGSIQGKGDRLFSERSDLKSTTIIGTDYFDGLDIWATYVYVDSNRGLNIPETTSLYDITEWGYWKRHSISLHAKYNKNNVLVDALAYYDKYDNLFNEYASLTHYEHNRPYAVSLYDEYAAGLNIKGEYNFLKNQYIRAAFSFREDDHKDYYDGYDNLYIKEDKLSLGLEYSIVLFDKLTFLVSGGFDSLIARDYKSRNDEFAQLIGVSEYQVNPKDRWLLAAQAGVMYEFMDNNELRLTYARRNQFPTMSDRYSTRFSETVPNPNLKPEVADHVELGYKGFLFDMLYIDTALYYSYVADKMGVIYVPDPFVPYKGVEFITNVDAVSLYGYELSLVLFPWEYTEIGYNMSVNEYYVHKSVSSYKELTYSPELTINSYVKIMPCQYFSITPLVEYVSERYTDLSGINSLDPYFLVHLYMTFNINDTMKIDFAVTNITDENYSYRYGYPMAGRTYSIAFSGEF